MFFYVQTADCCAGQSASCCAGQLQVQDFLLSASQIIVLYFFHSIQILGLLCSEFFLQYGLTYIFMFYVTTLENETFRVRFPL